MMTGALYRRSAPRHPRKMPPVRHAQRDEIRLVDAKLVRNAMDLPFLGHRDRLVSD